MAVCYIRLRRGCIELTLQEENDESNHKLFYHIERCTCYLY